MAWQVVVDDNFTRANTTASANPGSAGNGWIDFQGNIYFINGNTLKGASPSGAPNFGDYLLRPSSENQADQRIVITALGSQITNRDNYILLRWQPGTGTNGAAYVLWIESSVPPSVQWLKETNVNTTAFTGSNTGLGAAQSLGTLTGTDTYTIDVSVVGTTLAVTVTDVTTSTVLVNNFTVTDTGVTGAGSYGLVLGKSGATGAALSHATTYKQQTNALIGVAPATGTVVDVGGSAQRANFTGSATTWTTTAPTITAGAGTLGAITVDTDTTAHATYTPPATAQVVTFTDSTDANTTATLTVDAASTTFSFSGPTTGAPSTASTNFTVALPASTAVDAAVTITPSDGGTGGTFTPSTVTLAANTPAASAIFTYTPTATAGARTLSVTNSGGLTNPSNLTYTVTTAQPGQVGDSNVSFAPFVFRKVGSSYAESNNANNRVQFGFTDTSLAVVLDVSSYVLGTGVTFTETGTTVTATFPSSVAGIAWVGMKIQVTGASVAGYNGTNLSVTAVSGSTLTYTAATSALGAATGGTVMMDFSTWPTVVSSIDHGPIHTALPSGTLNGSNQYSIVLGSGLTNTLHEAQVWFDLTTTGIDRWTNAVGLLRMVGFTKYDGSTALGGTYATQAGWLAATSAYPYLRSKTGIVYGDSITAYEQATMFNGGPSANKTLYWGWHYAIGALLDAELSNSAYNSTSWSAPPNAQNNLPPFYTTGNDAQSSWNKYYSGQSRLTTGLMKDSFTGAAPDFVVVNHGTNDSSSLTDTTNDVTVQDRCTHWIADVRAACPNAWIFVVVPFGGFKRAVLTAAVVAAADAKCVLIDSGGAAATNGNHEAQMGIQKTTDPVTPTLRSTDAIHPTVDAVMEYVARMAPTIYNKVVPPTGTGSGGRRRFQ